MSGDTFNVVSNVGGTADGATGAAAARASTSASIAASSPRVIANVSAFATDEGLVFTLRDKETPGKTVEVVRIVPDELKKRLGQ